MIRSFVLALLAASAFAGAALPGVAHATTGASQGSVEAVTWWPPKITH